MKLELLQLTSPALPIGAFSYSEGLEWLVQNEVITNEQTLYEWIQSELVRGQVRIEACSISNIMDDFDMWRKTNDDRYREQIIQSNSRILSLRDSSEVRSQQLQMGRSLIQLLKELGHSIPFEICDVTWTIGFSWAGICWEISKIDMIEAYLYSWIANQLSASLRLLALGPTKAQKIQNKLLPLIQVQSDILLKQNPSELWTSDIGATMAQQSHVELYSRLFRS